MKAVILAGGAGIRLRPITYEIPKPLVTVKKKAIISHVIDFLLRHNIEEIAIVISESHIDDFKSWSEHLEKEKNITLHLFIEREPAGTFACLRHVQDWIGQDDFMVVNGDCLIDFNLNEMIDFHIENNKPATTCIVTSNTSGEYVIPLFNQNNMISDIKREFIEAGSSPILAGFYIFKPNIFNYDDVTKKILLTERDIVPQLIHNSDIVAFETESNRFYDCGTIESWEKAILEW